MPESTGGSTSELLKLQEAARSYGFSEATMYNWRHQGKGPRSVRLGRRVYYRRADIEAWIESQMASECKLRTSVGASRSA